MLYAIEMIGVGIMQIYKKRHYDKLLDCLFAPLLDDGDLLTQLRANTILAKGQRYFDFTASGLAYKKIEKRIDSILPYYANTHSRFATHSAFMSVIYERAKERLKEMLGLDDEFVLIAGGSGASFGIKKFQELMGIYMPPKSLAHFGLFFQGIEGLNDEKNCASQNPLLEKLRVYDKQTKALNLPYVLLSGFEHHSNEISFREGLCHIHKIGFDKAGLPDVGHLKKILQNLKDKKIIASLSVASNVTGLLAPIESYSKLLRENKATIAFDMASSSSYMQVDSYLYDAGFFAPHKLLGGVGSCGLLAIRKNLCDTQIPPSFAGGGTMEYANDMTHSFIDDEALREEAGTPDILGLLRAALAYSLRNEIGFAWIKMREEVLMEIFLHELKKIPAVSIYGDLKAERLGIVSFNIGSISPLNLSMLLSKKYGIQTRAGCSCAGPYGHYLLGNGSKDKKPMWLRVSIHYTHTLEDIEYLIESIKSCVKILRGETGEKWQF